jgi:multidrug resistance efflux pump
MRSRIALDEQRNDQNIEDMRMRWLESRVNLATLKVTFENSRRDLERANRLFPEKIISEAELDSVRAVHDALQAEIRERTVLVDGLQKTHERLEAAGRRDRGDSLEVLNRSLAAQEKQLAQGRTVSLRAPMDGVVRAVYHRLGEQVDSGTPIITIASHRSETIVGFVRQPLNLSPRPGMAVEIRTRGPKRQIASSNIRSVGSDLEQVASPLRLRGFDSSVERGLAFYVDLPPSLEVHPGEVVDLIVRPDKEVAQ